jgi:hypothetical protein
MRGSKRPCQMVAAQSGVNCWRLKKPRIPSDPDVLTGLLEAIGRGGLIRGSGTWKPECAD